MATDNSTCKYVYKKCFNARTTKKNGNLHSLCEFHRAKANSIQKAYATKKRSLHKALKSPTAVDTPIPYSPAPAPDLFDVSETDWLAILDALGAQTWGAVDVVKEECVAV
ncbi:hypothetical protein ACHHYP_11896 [Achlya hypogyna]|uniref:Uncharacterized protein n=1 Tax=Achlya hypogyna TaxID=1202772 RepID=A0A1V9YI39_ACHHY|nr:hypothetical protein ACHHYP_11896 [Achlya hypogyna]